MNNDIERQLRENIKDITNHLEQLLNEQKKLYNELEKSETKHNPRSSETTKVKETEERNQTQKNIRIGDIVVVKSNHKNRNGNIVRIVGYRGTTQYVVRSSTETGTELKGNIKQFSVWRQNVSVVIKNKHEQY